MRWPRIRTKRRDKRAPSEFAPGVRILVVRNTRILKASRSNPVQVALIDGLRGTYTLQLRRTIGGAYEHRHTCFMRLHNSGMKLHRRGS